MRVKNVGSTGRGIESSGSQAAAAGSADVGRIVAAASAALATWSQTGPGARRALLLKAADLMESRNAEFEKLMLEEIGATAPWPGFNVDLAAGILRESAALTTLISGEVTPPTALVCC
jgi:acyl-CoA reductase-like NAD-dependent aldehyde dehydrogenase